MVAGIYHDACRGEYLRTPNIQCTEYASLNIRGFVPSRNELWQTFLVPTLAQGILDAVLCSCYFALQNPWFMPATDASLVLIGNRTWSFGCGK